MSYQPSRAEKIFGGDLWRLRKLFRVITMTLVNLAIVPQWRHALRRRIDAWLIAFNKDKIAYFVDNYPKVLSEEETIRILVQRNCSIARYGDGEFNMLIGRNKSFQVQDAKLLSKLREVLESDHPDILIGINTIRSADSLSDIWKKFVIRRGNRVLALLDPGRTYYSSTITTIFPREEKALQRHVDQLKQIWQGRKCVFVVGKNSRFFFTDELFGNMAEHEFVYAPAKNAFAEYDRLMSEVQQYPKDWLILISLGPTATVMVYDLAKLGYQAIDLGQTPSKFHRAKYGTLYPPGYTPEK